MADQLTTPRPVKPHDPSERDASVRMQDWITQYSADRRTLGYRFQVALDPAANDLKKRLYAQWLAKLQAVDFAKLSRASKVDYLLLKNEIEFQASEMARNDKLDSQAKAFVPGVDELIKLCIARENVVQRDPAKVAGSYDHLATGLEELTASIEEKDSSVKLDPIIALRVANLLKDLKQSLGESHRFYQGYDPMYSWWADSPYKELDSKLATLRKSVAAKLAGVAVDDKDTIVGQPIGDEAIASALRHEMIPYTTDELVKIAEREFVWCDKEFKKASAELGYGDDWNAALDHVKELYVPPGDQPKLVKQLAWEAIDFLRERDLLTIPPMAANGWRMDMMSPEAQAVNPYFLGGPKVIVSFPTNDMTHDAKLMSLRSNNIHFCRATVHHELIPGHHLQHYSTKRYNTHRSLFNTPFWVEGWALYWEMRLWDLNFHNGPEDRIGMLFWRRHRCARIVFSLNYQSGRWPAQQCVDYLIERVGHEPAAAKAEVRRSVMGGYGPLYQAAYMLGGLQIRALHQQLVVDGDMPEKQFHDRILQQNSIPIEMVRAAITDVELTVDHETSWRFAGELQ